MQWTYVFSDRLISIDPSLRFSSKIQVTWRRLPDALPAVGPHTAARLVRPLIDEAAATCDVLRQAAAEQDITATLDAQLPLGSDGVEVVHVRIRLTVDEETYDSALQAEQLRHAHQREVARLRQDHERHAERLQREYELDDLARRQVRAREEFLRREILANPASARLYSLLERSTDNWQRLGAPPVGTDVTELVREVQQWQPGQRWVTAAQLLHDFVSGLSNEGRKELLTILADSVRAYGNEEVAKHLANLTGEPE
ncbi:hypothetical protein ACGF0D_34685 [Kitasatospora sp. NPDC048298]|uniref:hypothetical protein n=1 Tax=Kitasatospora sp. NPDC048298 TaxID=3364049 RepID=UPI0037135856